MNQPQPEQLYRVSWIILGSMVAGVAALAAVAAAVRPDEASALPWFAIWMLIGPLSVVLAKILLGRFLARSGPLVVTESDTPPPSSVLTAYVVSWALIEGPAMLGGVAYLLGASSAVLVAALATAAVGFAITAPKRETFGLP